MEGRISELLYISMNNYDKLFIPQIIYLSYKQSSTVLYISFYVNFLS